MKYTLLLLVLICVYGCAPVSYTPVYTPTRVSKSTQPVPTTSKDKILKLVSFTPKNMNVQSDSIEMYRQTGTEREDSLEFVGTSFFSLTNSVVEDEGLSIDFGITSPSTFYYSGVPQKTYPAVFEVTIMNKTDEPLQLQWDNLAYIDSNGMSHKVIKSGTRLIEKSSIVGDVIIPPNAKIKEFLQPGDLIYYSSSGRGWRSEAILENINLGDRVTVFIPIEIREQVRNYTFTFEVQ